MPKLSPLSHQDLVKRLHSYGFDGPYSGGKHLFMIKGTLRLTLPNPHKHEIGVALLDRILKQAGISKEEWLR
ncbi:MAG: type II toxin-antitoxin system HicA family toxin [Gammaproteobacteria bacterium]|nr:type II toxin-antitoxin system HicA family toxin [Gammaproteobacteria bacterium]